MVTCHFYLSICISICLCEQQSQYYRWVLHILFGSHVGENVSCAVTLLTCSDSITAYFNYTSIELSGKQCWLSLISVLYIYGWGLQLSVVVGGKQKYFLCQTSFDVFHRRIKKRRVLCFFSFKKKKSKVLRILAWDNGLAVVLFCCNSKTLSGWRTGSASRFLHEMGV